VTNFNETLDFISSKLAVGECINVIFFNFLKAFDMVPHRRLLKKNLVGMVSMGPYLIGLDLSC
jgi:hypothetical protein